MRWRYGDTNPVTAAVDRDTVIEIGDLLWQDIDDALPAGRAMSLKEFKANFLGVAMQRSREGDSTPIRVATTGIFEFDADGGSFTLGDMICPAVVSGTLCNQRCRKAEHKHEAIGHIEKSVTGDPVLVRVFSIVMGPV